MSGIGGQTRENTGEFVKKVGLFEGKVIAINPTVEQYKEILNIEVKEDSKAADYLGEKEGNTTLRVDVWIEDIHEKSNRFKVSFFLEDRIRQNKDETKYQFINNVGMCTWGEDENDLSEWFVERDYKKAHVGEEELYTFLRVWLGKLDFRHAETVLTVDWKKLMKGNVKDLKEQINGEYSSTVGCLATVITKEKDNEVKTYQGIYNKAFLPGYALKNFKFIDYSDPLELEKLSTKKTKDLKIHEKFVVGVTGDYGCKDFYTLTGLKDYDPTENLMSSSETIAHEDDDKY